MLGNDRFATPLALHLRMRISDDVSGGELARGALFVRAPLRQHSGLAALRRRGADALQLTADVYEKSTFSFRLRLSSKKWG